MSFFLQLPFPQVIFRPPVGKGEDRARCRDLHSASEHMQKDLPLQGCISHVPKRVAERMLHEQRPRGFDLLGDLFDQRQGNGRKTGLIQHALNQSHGLLTDRSGRDQENQIDLVLS